MRREACVNNLKQIGLVLNLYAYENKDRFPPIDDTKNNFIFDANLLYPEYLTDPTIAMCPGDPRRNPDINFRLTADHPVDGTPEGQVHPDCFTGDSYIYLGWMTISDWSEIGDRDGETFFEAYDALSREDYDADISVPEGLGNAEGDTLHRLSAGVDRFLYFDINMLMNPGPSSSMIPLVWDRPFSDATKFNHRPSGGNVLYMDGHVEFWEFGDDFPMTETMARLLEERARKPISHCE
jgi:prepilin-type processing-associated H-X9-DG protein